MKYLVNFLAENTRLDTSMARRAIIEGRVTVDGVVVTDTTAELDSDIGQPVVVGYGGGVYTYRREA